MKREVLELTGRCFEDPDRDNAHYAFETDVAVTQTAGEIFENASACDLKKAALRLMNMVTAWTAKETLPFVFDTFKDVVEVRVKDSVRREVDSKFKVRASMLLKFENGKASVDVNQLKIAPWPCLGMDFTITSDFAVHCALKILLIDVLLGNMDPKCRDGYYKLVMLATR